ncbi:MAG: hypothetical protein QXP36_05885 [Conexivisphaerales archaeon]
MEISFAILVIGVPEVPHPSLFSPRFWYFYSLQKTASADECEERDVPDSLEEMERMLVGFYKGERLAGQKLKRLNRFSRVALQEACGTLLRMRLRRVFHKYCLSSRKP